MTAPPPAVMHTVSRAVGFILDHQRADGSILSFPDGRLDPWDHVECAMALAAGGRHIEAARAYAWIADAQQDDGSIFAAYEAGIATDRTRDSNFASYLAVGSWHHFLIRSDRAFAEEIWPAVEAALDFAVGLQSEDGAIYWARDDDGNAWTDTLVASAASVRAALRCGEWLAAELQQRAHHRWAVRRTALEGAFRRDERRWGRTLPEDTRRFAMHWYYPVLCGLLSGDRARRRIDSRRDLFLRQGEGCRCVSDRPWVTVAESCELAMALDACGRSDEARELLSWQLAHQEEDGGFRTGTVPAYGPWPDDERPSWTAAAVVLACDALYGLTPGGALFRTLAG